MAYEHKPGTFSLFKNDKGGNESRPDFTGEGKDMNGNDIRVACWTKTSGTNKFLSCKMQPKEEKKKQGGQFADIKDDLAW